MRNLSLPSLFLVVVLLSGGCSKQMSPSFEGIAVDPASVASEKAQSVILVEDSESQATCLNEVKAQGGTVLYQGASGLILTDLSKEELNLKCSASVSPNETIYLDRPSNPEAEPKDLAYLLRLIPAEEIGARSFVKNNPSFDGRNAIIAVLDTGVDVDHPMLRKTSTGETKVIEFEDFSGEGKVKLEAVTVAEGSFKTTEGVTYTTKSVDGSGFSFGIFLGSTITQADRFGKSGEKVKDLGVVSYLRNDKRYGRIDTNADKSFDDEVELSNYFDSQQFIKLGEKKSLTTVLNLATDGKTATVVFDDGSHGTHVAGIAAGYEANGLKGVAPGAKVVAVKIGDNRLSGGSTTTASMFLAIEHAVLRKAQVVNLSYGIRAGSNLGKSAIEKYVDKIALEKGILFSISAGNEGPGLLTIGVPAGANLAITSGAYLSRQTARDNYGYVGVEDDNTWYFSSVGPRLDGGWKPSILAPGTAVASVPQWMGSVANFRGTSMAAPQTSGGLALLLSAATQTGAATNRASITKAVYQSAKKVSGLSLIEQGHGLFQVPAAFELLKKLGATPPVEYSIAVNSPTSPDGKGEGIYVRSNDLPDNLFTVNVTPVFAAGTSGAEKSQLRRFRLEASDAWIQTVSDLWMNETLRAFEATLDPQVLKTPGIHSGRIVAIDESNGLVAFSIPVTVVAPIGLTSTNRYQSEKEITVKVGHTERLFYHFPSGTTAVSVSLESDGQVVWGQLLNPEGRLVGELRDAEATLPLPPLSLNAAVKESGVFELDVVAPAPNSRPAKVRVKVQAASLVVRKVAATGEGIYDYEVQNGFSAVKFVPKVVVNHVRKASTVVVEGNATQLPFTVNDSDVATFSSIGFGVKTSKKYFDLMTDYPYRLFDGAKKLIGAAGLQLDDTIVLADLKILTKGTNTLEVQGAFTEAAQKWGFSLTESRMLAAPQNLWKGKRLLLESGQTTTLSLDLSAAKSVGDYAACPELILDTPDGKTLQKTLLCE